MTLGSLLSDCYRRLGFPTSPASATTTRLTAFLNETQQEILSLPGSSALLRNELTLASVANQGEYSLEGPMVSRIFGIRDTTNRRQLDERSEAWYHRTYPGLVTAVTGLADSWVDLGFSPIVLQPSNASELFVISTAAGDDATKTAFVEGYRTTGYYRAVDVAMNGVTAVSLGSTITDWIAVTKFGIVLGAGGSTTAAGVITLREDSGTGTVLATIPITGSFSRYRRIALAPTPSAVTNYMVNFEPEITTMDDNTDEPVIAPRFHRLLMLGARMKEYETTDNSRYAIAKQEYAQGISQLIYWLQSQAAGSPNLRGQGPMEPPSRLGAWYPSVY